MLQSLSPSTTHSTQWISQCLVNFMLCRLCPWCLFLCSTYRCFSLNFEITLHQTFPRQVFIFYKIYSFKHFTNKLSMHSLFGYHYFLNSFWLFFLKSVLSKRFSVLTIPAYTHLCLSLRSMYKSTHVQTKIAHVLMLIKPLLPCFRFKYSW